MVWYIEWEVLGRFIGSVRVFCWGRNSCFDRNVRVYSTQNLDMFMFNMERLLTLTLMGACPGDCWVDLCTVGDLWKKTNNNSNLTTDDLWCCFMLNQPQLEDLWKITMFCWCFADAACVELWDQSLLLTSLRLIQMSLLTNWSTIWFYGVFGFLSLVFHDFVDPFLCLFLALSQ